ncbi:MAG: lmo0937 family membrane protein [Acidobacteriaceae bacterium]
MFLVIGIVLFLAWIGGFLIFHVASFFIHVLLVLAIIAIVFHFLRGSR